MYKDHMKLPPVEERGLHHSNTLIEVDVPFDEAREKAILELQRERK